MTQTSIIARNMYSFSPHGMPALYFIVCVNSYNAERLAPRAHRCIRTVTLIVFGKCHTLIDDVFIVTMFF